jgi:hypothetical protein
MREHARDRRADAEEPAQQAPAVEPRSQDVLALQRSAGNQAVGRWLAREGAVAEEGGTGTREKESDWKVTISGIGSFDVSAVSWSGTSRGRGTCRSSPPSAGLRETDRYGLDTDTSGRAGASDERFLRATSHARARERSYAGTARTTLLSRAG